MGQASLEPELALKLASSLKTVIDYPWDTVVTTAEDLTRWCTGAILNGRVYDPEAQARWLITEIRDTWQAWAGTAAMKQLLDTKFKGHSTGPDQAEPLGTPAPIQCHDCNDTGTINRDDAYTWCPCEAGYNTKTALGPEWLDFLNRGDPRTRQAQRQQERARTAEELERYRQRRAQRDIEWFRENAKNLSQEDRQVWISRYPELLAD
jgi:hypothetical protein